jgi:hypothetical protein
MKHCFLTKKKSVEAKAWLDKHYTNSAPAKLTVEKWFAKFKRGKMSIEDDTYENIKKVHKIILNDRKVKLIEIGNGSSKMQTAPILKSSTVSNYGDISQIFIFIFGHT